MQKRQPAGIARLLGPAFVAAVAYVDPGNVAANVSAGAQFGYMLVWVLVLSNVMAVLVQYLSAKLGAVTGVSLPQLVGDRLSRPKRLMYWVQAEVVAAATDLAEVIGGALALYLLFGLPLVWGGVITGIVSLALLAIHSDERQQVFERVVIGMLAVIAIGFLAGLFVADVDPAGVAGGLVPRFAGTESLLIAASMVGATVMPHAIYLHSALSANRHRRHRHDLSKLQQIMHASRVDVLFSLVIAGSVNIGLLILAAAALPGVPGTDTIEGAHAAITEHLGATVGVIFGVGLLASGLASSSVGAYAGDIIMKGLLHVRVPRLGRRVVTLLPAIVILALGADPTRALILSQVVLSMGIPFAMIPLIQLTRSRELMGEWANSRWLGIAGWLVAVLIIALNIALLVLMIPGVG